MGSRKLVDRVLNFMGFEEDEQGNELTTVEEQMPVSRSSEKRQRKAVVNLPTAQQMKVAVAEPRSFDDARDIAEYLKSRRPVVVNLENVDTEEARRIVDFVSGATFALNGSQKKVGGGIFLFAPSNVEIEAEANVPDLERSGILPWMKS